MAAHFNPKDNNPPPLKSLWFRTGSQGQKVGQSTPAWEAEALVAYDELLGGASPAADKLLAGFIQTVESLSWEALYSDGWGGKASVGQKSRDAFSAKVQAPWYQDRGSAAKGAPFPLDDAGNNHPMLTDEPMVRLSVAHPDDDGWCKKITQATMSGKFHLWFVVLDTRQPLAQSSMVFLYYTSISMDKKWVLSPGGDPFDLTKWTPTGSQNRSTVADNKGSQDPVLDTPVANPNITFATHMQGSKCPKKTAEAGAATSGLLVEGQTTSDSDQQARVIGSRPGGTALPGRYRRAARPPLVRTAGAPTTRPISGLNGPARDTRCLRFARWVAPPGRKTRFRLLARLYRVGSMAHWVPPKGFSMFPTSLLLSQAYPGAVRF